MALCSANFLLSKSLVLVVGLDIEVCLNVELLLYVELAFDLDVEDLNDPLLFKGLLDFFSIIVEFLFCDLAN